MKKQVLFFVMMLIPLMASAQIEINGIYYNLNQETKQAGVTSGRYTGNVVIPETVTSGSVTYSVTNIGAYAFYDCRGLTSITIPSSVTSIEKYAFELCLSLESVIISDIAAWCNISFVNGLSNPLYYAHHLFLKGVEVKDLVIPNNVTTIGSSAFFNCSSLTSVTIPNSVKTIGTSAFHGCSDLKSVNISDIVAWCNISFSDNPLNNAHHLFLNEEEVKDLILPNSVTSIGISAFSGCSGLTSVTIPNSVTSIGSSAFSGCSGLTSVTIPNSVTSIGDNAFSNCSGITSIIIGKGIESIGSSAFADCESLEDLYCQAEKVPSAETNAFDNSYISYATLHVPENSINQYRRREPWSGFETITGILDDEFNDGDRCEKPIITILANGKVKVECATEGATCVTNITASNAEPLTNGEISLNTPLTVYTVTSYATKEGYNDSEVATATFRYEKAEGDMNGDGMLNITDVIHLVNMILGQ